MTDMAAPGWVDRGAAWLRAGRGGLFLLALLVGAGSGLGAVAFRYLIISLPGWPPGTASSASRVMWAARTCPGSGSVSSWSSR